MIVRGIDLKNCAIGSVNSRADHSLRFSVETAEMSPQEGAVLLAMHGMAARVLIEPLDADEGPVQVETKRDTKTHSQRLRASIFMVWKTTGQTEPFEAYYAKAMEKLIDHVQSKIKD